MRSAIFVARSRVHTRQREKNASLFFLAKKTEAVSTIFRSARRRAREARATSLHRRNAARAFAFLLAAARASASDARSRLRVRVVRFVFIHLRHRRNATSVSAASAEFDCLSRSSLASSNEAAVKSPPALRSFRRAPNALRVLLSLFSRAAATARSAANEASSPATRRHSRNARRFVRQTKCILAGSEVNASRANQRHCATTMVARRLRCARRACRRARSSGVSW